MPLLLRGHRGGSFLRVWGQEGQRGSRRVEQGRGGAGARAGLGGTWVPGYAEHRQESPAPLHWKPGPVGATAGSERCAWGAEMRGLQQE